MADGSVARFGGTARAWNAARRGPGMGSKVGSVNEDRNPLPAVRLAASVILLRGRAGHTEVFVQHRAMTMDFAAGMVVFPGGRTDDADRLGGAVGTHPADVVARHAAAWRATSIGAGGDAAARAMAGTLLTTAQREVLEETGASLAAEALQPWANWVTPPGRSKRFDTYFYLARTVGGDGPRHQTTEAVSSGWMPVQQILAADSAGMLQLMRPTRTLLRELLAVGTIGELFNTERDIVSVGPEF